MAGGCPRRASGPSVPLSADTASPPPRLCGPGGRRPRAGRRGRAPRLRPLACRGLRGRSLPFESFLAPQAAFGCHCPWGVGGWGRSRATRRGPAVVAGGVGSRPPVRRRSPSRPRRRCFPAPGRRGPPPYAALPLRCLSRRASAARAPLPGAPPSPARLAPGRDGRLAPGTESACASAPRGRVPRRRPAGRRGVCPPLRALPPGCGRAAVRAPALSPRGRGRWRRWRSGGDVGRGRALRPSPVRASAPVRAPTLLPPRPAATSPPAPAPSVPWPPARAPRPAPPRRLPLCPPPAAAAAAAAAASSSRRGDG